LAEIRCEQDNYVVVGYSADPGGRERKRKELLLIEVKELCAA